MTFHSYIIQMVLRNTSIFIRLGVEEKRTARDVAFKHTNLIR